MTCYDGGPGRGSDGSLTGALLEVGVYGYVLLQGAGLLADGSELLLEVVEPGIIGGACLSGMEQLAPP